MITTEASMFLSDGVATEYAFLFQHYEDFAREILEFLP
jgi:hypothetical protein